MNWGLLIANRAKRQLRRLSRDIRVQVDEVFFEMRANPFAGDVKLLRGTDGTMRCRVGDFRILFELDRTQMLIVVTAIKRRGSNTY